MEVRLVVEKGARKQQVFRMRKPEFFIGRKHECDIRIPASDVSRRHCRLNFFDGLLYVEDLDSANGTQLNGESVAGRQVAQPGDRLKVGPVTFVIEYELSADAQARLPQRSDSFEIMEAFDEVPESDLQLESLEELAEYENNPSAPAPLLPVSPLDEPPESAGDDFAAHVAEDEVELASTFTFDGDAVNLPTGDNLRDLLAMLEAPPEEEPPKKKKK